MSRNAFLVVLSQRMIFVIFLFGKLLRFAFFVTFLYFLVSGADNLAGYDITQTMFFFLTFVLVDTIAQFLFREVYRFRPLLLSGDFDLVMVKPFPSLFRVLLGGPDFIDLITIPPLLVALIYVGVQLSPSSLQIFFYLILIANAMIIATAFHIAVLATAVITLEIDHTVMIYRDITSMGRFPVDIYAPPLRAFLTFLIPVGIMVTYPAKALMGLLTPIWILLALLFSIVLIIAARRYWHFALMKYTSASS
jgi:ABC-2 type transport system permease protein